MSQRVPPQSLEQERALLGCVLLDSATYGLVEGIVRDEDFYAPTNSAIWRAFASLHATHRPIDQITLRTELANSRRLEAVGGDEYLLSLTDTLPTASSAESYARTVAELASRRRLIAACIEAAEVGYDTEVAAKDFFESTERSVLGAIRDSTTGAGLVHISVPLRTAFERMHRIASSGGAGVTGLPTGITGLDRMTTGMHPGDLIVVAGRPGMGKSSFMTDLILTAGTLAMDTRDLVATFSLEMQSEMVASRLAVADANVDLRAMRAAQLDANSMGSLVRSVEHVHGLPIYVDETPSLSIAAIRSRARRLRARGPLSLIVVDYLQLMGAPRKGMQREEVISESSRGLKELGKELGCPVVALSQLNREVEKRPDKRPQLSDLRESGAIEQDADGVWLLFRKGYYAAQAAKNKPDPRAPRSDIEPGVDDGITEIIVAKQRNGPGGVVTCLFRETSAHFVNLERDYPAHWSDGDA